LECDQRLKTFLIKYATELEQTVVKEATTISPLEHDAEVPGLMSVLQKINFEHDFEEFTQAAAVDKTLLNPDMTMDLVCSSIDSCVE
jgi:hypothetical protein